jgi:hypothetical protein
MKNVAAAKGHSVSFDDLFREIEAGKAEFGDEPSRAGNLTTANFDGRLLYADTLRRRDLCRGNHAS